MTLILSGTNGLSDVDGSAATPAIRGTDTNTGIFFPAADTVGITTGGTERARVDSSGNLGLGVTPSAWSIRALQVGSGYAAWSSGVTNARTFANTYYDGSYKYMGTGRATQYEQDGYHAWYTSASGTAGNVISFTQAMTLDASGNLGVGTNSPGSYMSGTAKLVAYANANSQNSILVRNDSNGASSSSAIALNASGNTWGIEIGSATKNNNALTFQLDYGGANSTKMTIDSSGNLLVGTTSTGGVGGISIRPNLGGAGTYGRIEINQNQNADGVTFSYNGTQVGRINVGTSSTAYVTSSDYRLKNTVAPMTGALDKVAALKPVTYKWNADGSDGEGFIAHELAEVCPQAVVGEKDAVDEDGNPKYQGIDTSFLVATLTAAIQELKAELDAAKAEIAALKGNA